VPAPAPAFDADGRFVSAGAFDSFELFDAPPKREPLSGASVLFELDAYALPDESDEELCEAASESGERSAKF
jgi:hypothetical protein